MEGEKKGWVGGGTGGKLNGKYHIIFNGTTAVANSCCLLCLTFCPIVLSVESKFICKHTDEKDFFLVVILFNIL